MDAKETGDAGVSEFDMTTWRLEKSINVLRFLAQLSEMVRAHPEYEEDIQIGLSSAIYDATKIASEAAGRKWHPKHRDLILDLGTSGMQHLEKYYGWTNNTQENSKARTLLELLNFLEGNLSDLDRPKIREFLHHLGTIDSETVSYLKHKLEAAAFDKQSWLDFTGSKEAILEALRNEIKMLQEHTSNAEKNYLVPTLYPDAP